MIDFVRDRILPSKPAQLLIQTGLKWQQDNCPVMGAALSYYALFSLFPILLVGLSVVGRIVGPGTDVFAQMQVIVARFLPPEAHAIVVDTFTVLNQSSTGAGIIGFALLLYTASTVFSVLNQVVDIIWKVEGRNATAPVLRRTVLSYVTNKITGFVLVFGTALLLFFSMITNLVVQGLVEAIATVQAQWDGIQLDTLQLATGLQLGSSLLILAIVALILLKILPSTAIAWRDIWPGALLIASLVVILQRLVSSSIISIGSRFASYGVIGGVMILMLWIYFTCQIFFIGCEFSYVYAHLFGSRRHRTPKDASSASSL